MLNTNNLHEMNFLRFVLPKLDERQLYKFANSTAGGGFNAMFLHFYSSEGAIILRTWQHIKNLMNEHAFKVLIVNLIELAGYNCDLWIELWNDTPLNLKQSVIRLISSESEWLQDMTLSITLGGVTNNLIHGKFLHHILQAASLEERNSFWHNCWETLIEALRTKDLQRIMQLCFKHEDDITQFKQNVMINSPVALRVCVLLLEGAHFDELNALVTFFHLESQTETHFKQQILQSAFRDEVGEVCKFIRQISRSTEKFYDFVKDVSAEFKINLLLSSPSFLKRLSIYICCGDDISLKTHTKFFDTFISTEFSEEDFTLIKIKLIQSLKDYITLVVTTVSDHDDLFRMPKFNSILLWCLGTNEAVQEFKLTCLLSLSRI